LTGDGLLVGVGPFVERDDSFALVPDVDQDLFAFDTYDRSFENRVDVVTFVTQVVLSN
jgi:hypothetical protein